MKVIMLEVPILDKPKVESGLLYSILHKICRENLCFKPEWNTQIGQKGPLLDLLKDITEFDLFRSNRRCVIQVTLHTLTLTLNLPDCLTILTQKYHLFLEILNQLESIPSNRFYSDSVCFRNPYAKPTYSSELRTWVQPHYLWTDSMRPPLGSSLFKSRFDDNISTGTFIFNLYLSMTRCHSRHSWTSNKSPGLTFS